MQGRDAESVVQPVSRLPAWLTEVYVLVDYRGAYPILQKSPSTTDALVLGEIDFHYFHSSVTTPVYKYKQEKPGWVCRKLTDFIEEQKGQTLSWVFQPYPFESLR